MSKAIGATLAAALFSLTTMAQATLVTWTSNNVTLDDRGTASGSFMLDPTIQTTPGSATLVPLEYSPGTISVGETFSPTLVEPSAEETILLAGGAEEAGLGIGRLIPRSSVTGVEASGFAVLLAVGLGAVLLLRKRLSQAARTH